MKRYVSLAGLAFELGISYPTALGWLRNGRLVSDAVCGDRVFLFEAERVEDLALQRILQPCGRFRRSTFRPVEISRITRTSATGAAKNQT